MKLIIAGSRAYVGDIFPKINPNKISEVVSGGAKGIDAAGERWAKLHGIPVKQFLPDWSLGKHAGKLRNIQMADYADMLLAYWDMMSPGTAHMIAYMNYRLKPVRIIKLDF